MPLTGWTSSEFTSAAGTWMHAAGLGPPEATEVVCVHGLGCSHRYFLPLARQLAPRLRVVAVDLPGFGRSRGVDQALDVRGLSLALAAWLRATGRERSVLIANSGGCQVVVDLAVHSPELVGQAILVGPTIDPRARGLARQLWRLAKAAPLEPLSLWWIVAGDYLRCGPRRILATARHLLSDPVEAKLADVAAPVTVVRGSRDPLVPREWGEEMASGLPNGRYVEVLRAGHALNYSAPVALAGVIRRQLGLTPSGAAPAGSRRGRTGRSRPGPRRSG